MTAKTRTVRTEADSFAALRNDKQKDEQRQSKEEQAQARAKANAGFFPFDKLRVSMTIVRGDLF
jgi:hypothetical protein